MREISNQEKQSLSINYSVFCERNKDVLKYFNMPIPSLEEQCVLIGGKTSVTNYDFIDFLCVIFSEYSQRTYESVSSLSGCMIHGWVFTELAKQIEICKTTILPFTQITPSVVGTALQESRVFNTFGLENREDRQAWSVWTSLDKNEMKDIYKRYNLWDYISKSPTIYKGIIHDGAKNSYKGIIDVCNKFGLSPSSAQYAVECTHEYGLHYMNDIYNQHTYTPPAFTLTENLVEEAMKKYPELGICGWPSHSDRVDRAKNNPVITWNLLTNGTDSYPGNKTNNIHIQIVEHLVNAFKGYGQKLQLTKNKSYNMYKEDIKHYLERTSNMSVGYLPQGLVVLACILHGINVEEQSHEMNTCIKEFTYKQMFTVYQGNARKKLNGYTICNF